MVWPRRHTYGKTPMGHAAEALADIGRGGELQGLEQLRATTRESASAVRRKRKERDREGQSH